MNTANSLAEGNIGAQLKTSRKLECFSVTQMTPRAIILEKRSLYGKYIRDNTYRAECASNGDSPLKMARA